MHNRMAAELTIENLAVDHPEEDEGSVSQSGHSVPHDDAKEKEDMKEAELKRMREFAARETKNVQRWRLTVLISIVAMGVLISSFTYKILKKEDDDDLIDSVSPSVFYHSLKQVPLSYTMHSITCLQTLSKTLHNSTQLISLKQFVVFPSLLLLVPMHRARSSRLSRTRHSKL